MPRTASRTKKIRPNPEALGIKNRLRVEMRNARRDTHRQNGLAFSEKIREHFVQAVPLMPQTNIAAYYPIGAEVNCQPLMETLTAMGHIGCIPAIEERDQPLIFRMYKPGDRIQRDPRFGLPTPLPFMPEVLPDIVILPVLGFGTKGQRLGYGTGFFDRTLEKLRAIKPVKAVGLAYSTQMIKNFPEEPHDQRMDIMITEEGVKKLKL